MGSDYYSQVIESKLVNAGIDIPATSEYRYLMEYLPEQNLKKLAEYPFGAYSNFNDLLRAFERYGWLKFVPYILDDNEGADNPSMCISYNIFMHMFRGYYFQLSNSPSGDGTWGNGTLRTDSLIRFVAQDSKVRDSKLVCMLLYAAMIDCGFQITTFRSAFYKNRDVIEDFFKRSMKWWGIEFKYNFDMVEGFITRSNGVLRPESDDDIIYEFRRNVPYCRFRLTDERVDVEYSTVTTDIISISIPDVMEGMTKDNPFAKAVLGMGGDESNDKSNEFPDTYVEELHNDLSCIFDNGAKVQHMLLLMLLKFAGIHACWHTITMLSNLVPLQDIKDSRYVRVQSFREILEGL